MSMIADNPYPGSRAFRQEDHGRFHGRVRETSAIIDLWTANRLTIVTGPPGCGKTSLLAAGVYPLMPGKRSATLPLGSLSYGMWYPFAALPEHNPFTLALLRSWSPDRPTRLAGLTVSDFVRRFTQGREEVTYAAIDQMDDLISDPRAEDQGGWRGQFLAELVQACKDHPRLHLLLVARSEALDLLTDSVGGGARYELQALTAQGAVEAITRPALGAGRFFTEEAAWKLIDDLRTTRIASAQDERHLVAGRVEPSLLQAVCRQLWDELPPGVSEVSEWPMGGFGDADAALAAYCATVIGKVAAEYGIAFKRLRSWLLDTFVADETVPGDAYEGVLSTAGLPNGVARSLVDQHLLTSELTTVTEETVRRYLLLSDRLAEPLRIVSADRSAAPVAADQLRTAERDLARGELDLAWQHGTRAHRLAPGLRERAQAAGLLGNVAYRQGKPTEALPSYREAANLLQAAGDTSGAAYQLAAVGQALLAEGDAREALPELRAAVERLPNDLVLQTQLARALWQIGEGRAAVAILNGVLAIDGGNLEALRSRGEILADLGDASSAILDLDRRSVPDRPSTRAARGLALAELGDHSAATREINDAVAKARHNGPVLLFAARASELTGDKASSRKWVKLAVNATDPPLSSPHREVARKLARRLAERT
jgi:tetratricopeptide (TPR) repeat protein